VNRLTTGTVLDEILDHKREEVTARQRQRPTSALRKLAQAAPPTRGFTAAIASAIEAGKPAVIAEIKKASPSKGVIRTDFDPESIAVSYQAAGATCLSVLTDERFFQGHDDYLVSAHNAVELPVLRKDFIIDEYQLYEARVLGADCVLLIVAAVNIIQLTVLYHTARALGLDVLMEVHDETELAAALSLSPTLVGINNRNLKTFDTSLQTTYQLLSGIPPQTVVVTESGIASRQDVLEMRENGVHCFLVGEAFMRKDDPGAALKEMFAPLD
jgi:indole-3-glycerol phosphate synthase